MTTERAAVLMNWLFRPSNLLFATLMLACCAAAVVLWPAPPGSRALPQPVADGDREIVWLYAATNTGPWERLVSAIDTAVDRYRADRPDTPLSADKTRAFPVETASVPEVTVGPAAGGRLVFRWYKLTSDAKTQDWVQSLLQRRPPPLAVIGGSSSDLALELANSLQAQTQRLLLGTGAPLLLLTTATVDNEPEPGERPLTSLYPGRTFRFCFTNRQMAEAVTSFIWSQDELRPDADPVYFTYWKDDPYSEDLTKRFRDVLTGQALYAAARDVLGAARSAAQGGLPVDAGNVALAPVRMDPLYWTPIKFSVGTYARPNRWEVQEAVTLLDMKLERYASQRRPLLVIPGASQPMRRFLRALARTAPQEAQRFVVATGDGIPFNTVYRDRNEAWHIQDEPFRLVFFTHRNPVDRDAGFREEGTAPAAAAGNPASALAGTEDLLLFQDIVDAVLAGAWHGADPAAPEEFRQGLSTVRWSPAQLRLYPASAGLPLFDADGNRRAGTGEHVVYVRPVLRGVQVLPRSRIEVWAWHSDPATGRRSWFKQHALACNYDDFTEPEGG